MVPHEIDLNVIKVNKSPQNDGTKTHKVPKLKLENMNTKQQDTPLIKTSVTMNPKPS